MKYVSIVLSFILFVQLGWGQSPNTQQSLQLEQKLQEAVGLWNQASTYSQLAHQITKNPEDEKFLKELLKKTKMERAKPPNLEYLPRQNKFVFRQNKVSFSLWSLELSPMVVLFDGKNVKTIDPQKQIRDQFNQERQWIDRELKKGKKTAMIFNTLFVNKAYADLPEVSDMSAHNAEIEKQVAENKKAAHKLSSFAKTLAMIFLGGLLVFPLLFGTANFVLDKAAPHYGPKRDVVRREDLKKTEESFIEIVDAVMADDEVEVKNFRCDSWTQFGYKGLKTVNYSYGNEESKDHEEQFGNAKTVEMSKNKIGDNLYKKVNALDQCCKLYRCENWLQNRMKDDNRSLSHEEFEDKYIVKDKKEQLGTQ